MGLDFPSLRCAKGHLGPTCFIGGSAIYDHVGILGQTPHSDQVDTYSFCMASISVVIVAPDLWLSFLIKQTLEEQRNKTNLIIYGSLVAGCFIFAIARAYGLLLVSLKCAMHLHDKMVVAILQAPVLFFDSNPAGRILNRFSNDIDCIDEHLPREFLLAVEYFLLMCTAVFIPIAANLWLLFVIIPLTGLYVYISKYYLKTSRELKRLESIYRSPVFSHFSETIKGLSTIQTRGRQSDFMDTFYRYLVTRLFRRNCIFEECPLITTSYSFRD